jgi:hypothetical protein
MLVPPNTIQDLIDQQVIAYRQKGGIITDAVLGVIVKARDTLAITDGAEELIQCNAKALHLSRALFRSSINVFIILIFAGLISIGSTIQAGNRRDHLVRTRDAREIKITQPDTLQAFNGTRATIEVEGATCQVTASQLAIESFSNKVSEVVGAQSVTQSLLEHAEAEIKGISSSRDLVLKSTGPFDSFRKGNTLWVACWGNNTISKINQQTNKITSFQIGKDPRLIFHYGEFQWVANEIAVTDQFFNGNI